MGFWRAFLPFHKLPSFSSGGLFCLNNIGGFIAFWGLMTSVGTLFSFGVLIYLWIPVCFLYVVYMCVVWVYFIVYLIKKHPGPNCIGSYYVACFYFKPCWHKSVKGINYWSINSFYFNIIGWILMWVLIGYFVVTFAFFLHTLCFCVAIFLADKRR